MGSYVDKVETELPVKTIRPTYVNRKEELLKESFEFAQKGGIIDLTYGSRDYLKLGKIIEKAKHDSILLENITFSSDGYGSQSRYDEDGNIIKIGVFQVNGLYKEIKMMVLELNFTLEEALKFVTTNVSKVLKLYPQKGVIMEGLDANLLIIDGNLRLEGVIANVELMMEESKVLKKGTYEQDNDILKEISLT